MPDMPERRDLTVLGLDYGERRLGVAVGQTLTHTATPLAVIPMRGRQPDWQAIERLLRQYQPSALVVGLPRYADGGRHRLEPCIRRFAQELRARFALPVHLIDERLSSHEAAGRAQARRGEHLDAVAAQVILETWLQEHAAAGAPQGSAAA